jgi:hypothetical protein
MENTLLVRRLIIEKEGNNYLYLVETLGKGNYSIISDDAISRNIEKARKTGNDELIYNTILNACKKVLTKNDVFFDNIEII